jgi:transposase IS116/IS110/IS902 family protein
VLKTWFTLLAQSAVFMFRAAPGPRSTVGSLPRSRPSLWVYEIVELDRELEQLVKAAAPRTTNLFGVGTQSASQLLVTAGQNIDRLRNEAAFARICGAAPIQASSGRTNRHRLDFGGDRQANRALHMTAVCRLRHCDRTRAYAAKRTADGLNRREILRCLSMKVGRGSRGGCISGAARAGRARFGIRARA